MNIREKALLLKELENLTGKNYANIKDLRKQYPNWSTRFPKVGKIELKTLIIFIKNRNTLTLEECLESAKLHYRNMDYQYW